MDIRKVRRRWFRATAPPGAWILVVCWALVIVTLVVQPGGAELGRQRLRVDLTSLGHVGYFGALAFLAVNALVRHGVRRAPWWAVVLTILFGIACEMLQVGVAGRTPSISDLLANLVGATIGSAAFALLARPRARIHGAPRRSGVPPGEADPRIDARLVVRRNRT